MKGKCNAWIGTFQGHLECGDVAEKDSEKSVGFIATDQSLCERFGLTVKRRRRNKTSSFLRDLCGRRTRAARWTCCLQPSTLRIIL